MSTSPGNQSVDKLKRRRTNEDYSPTPSDLLRSFVVCLRGFHLHRERPRITDYLGVFLSLAVALAAFWSAWIFDGQLREMHKSNEQARTQWSAEHRPWVGSGQIGFKQSPTFFIYPRNPTIETQVNLDLEIPIKNVGVSPALHVETEFTGTLSDTIAAPPTLESRMQYACSLADKNAKTVGEVLFPNSPETRIERLVSIGVPLIRITQVHRVWVAICIGYGGATFGGELHHTKIWMASWPIEGQPTQTGTIGGTTLVYSLPIPQWGVIRTEAD